MLGAAPLGSLGRCKMRTNDIVVGWSCVKIHDGTLLGALALDAE